MGSFNGVPVPSDGQRIEYSDGKYRIPDRPIIPFIEGDGTGRDIWKASVRVFDAAIEKAFGGKKSPRIGVLEFRQPFQAAEPSEYALLCELFRRHGCQAEIVSPDLLEYRNGELRQGDFVIDLVFRRVKVQEFLLRYDLSHPLVRAYGDRAVCVINSFRSELAHKKAIFDLLTDETVTAGFPAAERKVIRDHIPWTRVVAAAKVTRQGEQVDLIVIGSRGHGAVAFCQWMKIGLIVSLASMVVATILLEAQIRLFGNPVLAPPVH